MSYRIEAMNGKWMLIPDGSTAQFDLGKPCPIVPDGTLKLFMDNVADPVDCAVAMIDADTTDNTNHFDNRRESQHIELKAAKALALSLSILSTGAFGLAMFSNHTMERDPSTAMDVVSLGAIAVLSLTGIISYRRKQRSVTDKTQELDEMQESLVRSNQEKIAFLQTIAQD